jgi:hypothetical protein
MPSPRANIVGGAFDLFQVHPAHLAAGAERESDPAPVAAVGGHARIGKGERLQPAAPGELPRHLRDEAVEQAILPILGLVDDSGARIDRGGFVVEAAHRL